jgi:hypothetical protein
MPVKAVILDLDGTLIAPSGRVVRGAPAMVTRLRGHGIHVFVASNVVPRREVDMGLLNVDEANFLDRSTLGKKKGTGAFVDTVLDRLGIESNELLYLGDTDNDMREAVNRKVILFLAAWSNPGYQYGIPVPRPERFADFVETFFIKSSLWYYEANGVDTLSRSVVVRALLDPDLAKNTGIQALLKKKTPGVFGSFSLADYLALHLLASVYLEGLHLRGSGRPAIWCVYPGHDGRQSGVLDQFANVASRLFHKSYEQSLIVRHTTAVKSAYARFSGKGVTIDNQLGTVHLDGRKRNEVGGRTVLVFDDFITQGHSFETARNFLYNAGAAEVISIAVGKYPVAYHVRSPKAGVQWDSFSPASLTGLDFDIRLVKEHLHASALQSFKGP